MSNSICFRFSGSVSTIWWGRFFFVVILGVEVRIAVIESSWLRKAEFSRAVKKETEFSRAGSEKRSFQ
ncbi:MAG: hypothetical protein RSA94_04330, partial [Mucinivorans sp.]